MARACAMLEAMKRSYDFDFFKVRWLGRYG